MDAREREREREAEEDNRWCAEREEAERRARRRVGHFVVPGLAGETEAARTIRDCAFIEREASEMLEVARRDHELLERLGRVRDSAIRYEREAQSVLASRN